MAGENFDKLPGAVPADLHHASDSGVTIEETARTALKVLRPRDRSGSETAGLPT